MLPVMLPRELTPLMPTLNAAIDACGFGEYRTAIHAGVVPCVALDAVDETFRPENDSAYCEELAQIETKYADVESPRNRERRIGRATFDAEQRANLRWKADRQDRLPVGASRIGGLPDLPAEVGWPSYAGRPLPFVAQVELASLPRWENCLLPTSGWLFAFADYVSETEDYQCRVRWHDCPADALLRAGGPPADGVEVHNLIVVRPRLAFQLDWDAVAVAEGLPPRPGETLPTKFDLDFTAWDVDERLADSPAFGGGDAATLLGKVEWEDYTALGFAHWQKRYETDWLNLMTVKSAGSMSWSDSGHLNLILREPELLARRFDDLLWATPGC